MTPVHPSSKMPALTIEGKREIIAMAQAALGEKKLLEWLKHHQIPSILFAKEQVRRLKAKFFRELFELAVYKTG